MKIQLSAFSDEAGNSFEEQVRALHENAISYTELRNIDGKTVNNFTVEEAKLYRKKFENEGIKVWALGSALGKAKINEIDFSDYLEKAKVLFDVTTNLGTEKIRAFSFFGAYGERAKVLDYVNILVETAKAMGVTYYHENEKDIYGDTAERVLDVLDNVPDAKCVYDPANFLQVGERADNTLAKIFPRAEYFHIKDVIFDTQELVPAGHGDGKIDEIIRRINFDTVFTLEPHLAVFDGYAQMDNTAMKNKFVFKSNREAFDTAVAAIKKLLVVGGYTEKNGEFVK